MTDGGGSAAGTHNACKLHAFFLYLILTCNDIELAPGSSIPVANNAILDSVASDQELSEREMRQEAALDGEALDEDTNLQLYITGKVIS